MRTVPRTGGIACIAGSIIARLPSFSPPMVMWNVPDFGTSAPVSGFHSFSTSERCTNVRAYADPLGSSRVNHDSPPVYASGASTLSFVEDAGGFAVLKLTGQWLSVRSCRQLGDPATQSVK